MRVLRNFYKTTHILTHVAVSKVGVSAALGLMVPALTEGAPTGADGQTARANAA